MSKNIFVAVGSTAVNGLIKLLERLKEDGVYAQRKDDVFVAIDSDDSRLKKFKAQDPDSSPLRLHTVQLTLGEMTAEHKIVKYFDETWEGIGGIGRSGVGGDRRKSFTALNWIKFWQDLSMDKNLQSGDRVILLGSAFGGTSTGMFWNVAEFIQKHIKAKLGDDQLGSIRFFGMLLLPEKSCVDAQSREYPLSRNMCAFLKDMQLIEWRHILRQNIRHFVSPVYSNWDHDNDKLQLPVYRLEDFKCNEQSKLPMEELFVLPTPDNAQGQTQLYFAELAFVLFYLDLANSITGTTVDKSKAHVDEESVFAGFNMVVAKSARSALLRKRFYELFGQYWNKFWRGDVADYDASVEYVRKFIRDLAVSEDENSVNDIKKKVSALLSDIDSSSLSQLNTDYLEKLEEARQSTFSNAPFVWQGFENLVRSLHKEVDNCPEELRGMPIAAIVKGYKAEYDEMKVWAEMADGCLEDVANNIQRAIRLSNLRARSKWGKLVNGSEGAKAEVESKTRVYLHEAVENCICAWRAKATLSKMPAPIDMDKIREIPQFARNAEQIEAVFKADSNSNSSAIKGFIYEDAGDDVNIDLPAPGVNFTKLCLDALLASDDSALQSTIKDFESRGVERIREKAEQAGDSNPLNNLRTSIPVDRLRSYSGEVFHCEDVQKGVVHFCYSCGAKGKIEWPTWGELRNDLRFSSFGKFPGAGGDTSRAVLNDSNLAGPQDAQWVHVHHDSGTFQNIQGIWLGTMDLNKKFAEIIKAVFKGSRVGEWEERAWQADHNGGDCNRLQDLRTMVYMGLIMGALEKKVADVSNLTKDTYNTVKFNVRVKSRSNTQTPVVLEMTNATPGDLGFSTDLCITNLRLEWIGKLVKWIASDFARDMELNDNSLDGKLLFEKQCLTNLKLSVPMDYMNEINALFNKLYDTIEVEKLN